MNASTGEDDDDGNDGNDDDGESNEKDEDNESTESILKYVYNLDGQRDREIMIKSILNLSIILYCDKNIVKNPLCFK
jgi:hypothetical protein